MSSDFGSKWTKQGIPKLLDRLGDAVTYTAVGGAGVSRQAVFNQLDAAGDDKLGLFEISTDPTAGIASPGRGDRITYGGDTWTVVDVRLDQDGSAELRCIVPQAVD